MTRPSLRRLSLGIGLVLVGGLAAWPQDRPPVAGPVGKVTDREGVAARKGLAESRWSAANGGTPLFAGDWIKTGAVGANALAVELTDGALLLGPGALVELVDGAHVRLHAGEVELTPRAKATLVVVGTRPRNVTARTVLRAKEGASEALAQDPRWLTGYRSNASTDAVGALVATVDGRDVPLTLGYHKVSVDIRDQVARTEIEESFVNQTGSRLEGVFYFPLPPDASISGFAMWIGDQQVHGEIVEKQRARAIFETILREKRDPALLEWSGGNLFKARVFPIEAWSQKRIKLTYTQVLAQTIRQDGKGELVYRHALASEHLRLHPLAKLAISVTVSSQRPIVDVSSPTHTCRVQKTEHAARVEHEAEEVSPDRDFEVRIAVTRPPTGLTLAAHRRGDDGYFLLLVDVPPVAATARSDEPIDLLILADTSGSLAGAARAAQLRFVSALLEGLGSKDTCNLATCDVDVSFAFEQPREPTPAAREEALGLLEGRRSLGWTDLDRAISAAAKRAGPRTHVVYVGDGAVTTGDADPQAFARRAPSLYAGKGTFHAVVPGSTSESAALQAIAKLGGGTVRTIAGAAPEDAAFALLNEAFTPCAKDLRLSFEGLEVAAVYPEVLPSLPAGSQQVVVGRWNAATAPVTGLKGRVTLTGTIGATKLSTTHEVALGLPVTTGAESPDDASFIPRLWARAHLDHLLSQGSSKELQARVVALSEEFQLITPYTSFLVLESDADRARFQVKKRLRIRDGEEFFAEGRADAQHALTRQAMLAARRWRRDLRKRTLEDLADMGREEGVDALKDALPDGGQFGAWLSWGGAGGGAGGGVFSFDSEEESDDDEGEEEEEPRVEEALDEALPSEEEEEEAEEDQAEQHVDAEDEPSFQPADDLDDGDEDSTRTAATGGVLSFDDGGGSYDHDDEALGSFRELLPEFSEPWRPEPAATSAWPKEVRDALASVDLTGRVARAQGGLRIRSELQRADSRGRLGVTGHSRWLLGPQRWVQAWSTEVEPSELNWLAPSPAGPLERGVVAAPWGIGRVRPAVASDARGWNVPWLYADLLGDVADRADAVATVRRLDADRVEVTLAQEGAGPWGEQALRVVLVIEPARGVLRSFRFPGGEGDTIEWEVAEVAGSWFPARETRTDTTGKVTEVTTFVVEALAPAAFEQAFAEALSARASSALLGPLPTRREARAAVRQGKARLEDRWALIKRLRRDDPAQEHLNAVLAQVPARAAEAIRAMALRMSRRQEELRLHLRAQADALVATPRPHEVAAALQLVTWSEELGDEERLDLIARVTPVFARHPDDAGAAWELGRQEAAALGQSGHPDAALARLRGLVAARPEELGRHVELARWFAGEGELDAAIALLDEALAKHGPWPAVERIELARSAVGFHAQGEDDQAVVARVERLEREDPDTACVFAAEHLTALTMLGRDDEVEARLRAWIEAALAGPIAAPARARLVAAVQHVLASGRLSDARAELLARLVRTQPEGAELFDVACSIVVNAPWQAHALGRATIAALIERLRKADLALILPLLTLVQYGPDTDDADALREAALDRLEARLALLGRGSPNLARILRQALDERGDDVRRLRLLRQDHTQGLAEGDARNAAGALVGWWLARDWSEEAQGEVLPLLAQLGPRPNDGPVASRGRRIEQALALHRFVDWATEERADVEVAARPDFDALDGRRLTQANDQALSAARLGLLGLLSGLEKHAPSLRDWLTLERAWLQVKLDRDREAARAACLGLLDARLALTSAADDDAAVVERALSTLLLLAGTDAGATQVASVAALSARLERGATAAGGDARIDWRQARVRLLLLGERLEEAEVALRDASRAAPWGFLHACLLAERDRLADAAAAVERLASEDEVSAQELLTLSRWYTALDRPDAARSAQARAWALVEGWRIEESLWRERERVAPEEEGRVPEELDPATDLKLIALARKTHPSELVDHVSGLYEATRDFRLLAPLAEGALGQSAENVYSLLDAVQGLTDLLQEEATLDQLRAAIAAVQARPGTTPRDARALRLLELVALCGAVAQEDPSRASAHADAALALLRAVGPEGQREWAAGEPLLYAELLVSLGVLPGAAGEEQLRQLQALVRLGGDATARLNLTRPLSTALVARARHEDAVRALEGSLQGARGPDGLLGPRLHWALRETVDLLLSIDRFRDAEALCQRELAPPGPARHGPRAMQGLRFQVHRIRLAALAKGAPALTGSGVELYRLTEAHLRADLLGRSSPALGGELVKMLVAVWDAGARLGPVRDDVKRFAFGDLPAVLARHQPSHAWQSTTLVIQALVVHADALTALELLVLRAEAEPVSARLRDHDLWARTPESFGELRVRAGAEVSPTLVLRLLELTKAELRRLLRSKREEYPSLCVDWMPTGRSRYFWREHQETFKQVALSWLAEGPDDGANVQRAAEYLRRLGCQAEGTGLLLDAERRGALSWEQREQLCRWLEEQGRLADALPIMRALIVARPDHLPMRLTLVRALCETGEEELALRVVTDAEAYLREAGGWDEYQGRHNAPRLLLANAYLNLGRPADALRLVEEALTAFDRAGRSAATDDTLAPYHELLANIHARLGDTVRAVDAVFAVMAARTFDRYWLTSALQLLDQVLVASPALDDYVARVDRQEQGSGLENATLRRAIGHAYRAQGKPEPALAHLRRALAAAPNDVGLRRELVELLDELERPEEAVEELLALTTVAGHDSALYLELGGRWETLGHLDLAERAWTNLVEALPNESESHQELARLREEQERLPEAVEQWRQVVRVRADEPSGWVSLVRALLQVGAASEAQEIARRLLATTWDERFGDVHGDVQAVLEEQGEGEGEDEGEGEGEGEEQGEEQGEGEDEGD